ncbi:hypothetical protein HanIR_Chr06g0297651 [Helianthus annuus]|nr:hypothetical protein HanIR_Chr06g0297651 [Helianthus annuus]
MSTSISIRMNIRCMSMNIHVSISEKHEGSSMNKMYECKYKFENNCISVNKVYEHEDKCKHN